MSSVITKKRNNNTVRFSSTTRYVSKRNKHGGVSSNHDVNVGIQPLQEKTYLWRKKLLGNLAWWPLDIANKILYWCFNGLVVICVSSHGQSEGFAWLVISENRLDRAIEVSLCQNGALLRQEHLWLAKNVSKMCLEALSMSVQVYITLTKAKHDQILRKTLRTIYWLNVILSKWFNMHAT